MRGVINKRVNFHDIEEAVITAYIGIALDVDYFTDKLGVKANFNNVKKLAFEYYGKFSSVWGINQFTLT